MYLGVELCVQTIDCKKIQNLQRGKAVPDCFPVDHARRWDSKPHPDYSDPTAIYHENLWINRGYYTSSVKVISENDTHIQTKRGL